MEPYRPIVVVAEAGYDVLKRVTTAAIVHPGRLHLFGVAPSHPLDAEIDGMAVRWTDADISVLQTVVPHCEDITRADYVDLLSLAHNLQALSSPDLCLRWTLAEGCVEIGAHNDLARQICQLAPTRAWYARTPVAYTVTWSLSRRVVITCYVTDPTILSEIA